MEKKGYSYQVSLLGLERSPNMIKSNCLSLSAVEHLQQPCMQSWPYWPPDATHTAPSQRGWPLHLSGFLLGKAIGRNWERRNDGRRDCRGFLPVPFCYGQTL